jgi:nucleoside 2-deoxyribosyltransferase
MRVYIAGSLRNVSGLEAVFTAVRNAGHEITFDYRRGGATPETLFGLDHRNLAPADHIAALARPAACAKFKLDRDGIDRADVLVLVKPCGESAIWEAGYAAGADKPVIVLLDEKPAPGELMQKFGTSIVTSIPEMLAELTTIAADVAGTIGAITTTEDVITTTTKM